MSTTSSESAAGSRAEPASQLAVGLDVLAMDAEQMRELGHWVVDRVVEHIVTTRAGQGPALLHGDPAVLLAQLGGPLPLEPGDPKAALQLLAEVALQHQQHGDHPRYFARVPGPAAYAGILGEWLATGFQTIASSWGGSAGPTTVELVVLRWLAEMLGLAAHTEGILVSGGSAANQTGLLAARAEGGDGVFYLSDQTHSSIARGLRSSGVTGDNLRILPSGPSTMLHPSALREVLDADRAAGLVPRVIVATAGSTNTGAVDPLDALADLAAEQGLWLHVDGAYGAPAALTARGRAALSGLERADSLVLDPHKWLFQPYDIGCLFVRHPGALERAFTMNPEYLSAVVAGGAASGEVDLRNRGLELSRRSRAAKLWLTLQTHGSRSLTAAVDRGLDLAEAAEALLRSEGRWRVVTPAQLGVVTFDREGAEAADLVRAATAVTDDGYAAVATTTLRGRTVLRLCTINPATTVADLQGTLDRLASAIDHPQP